MSKFICLFCVLGLFAASLAASGQTYRPQKGETDMRLDISGKGTVVIKLFTQEAPRTTAQIIRLVREGFYTGQRFHRVEKNPKPYLVEVGDPASKTESLDDPKMGLGGSGSLVPYEDSGHQNIAGAVGLARTVGDQDSGDSLFYMLLDTAKFLDGHYTVFGQVVSGMDVVQRIEKGDKIASVTITGHA